jgi:hypothetical protein
MKKISGLYFVLLQFTLFSSSAFSQEYFPIIDNYSCLRLSDGKQFLVRQSGSGFSLVTKKTVTDTYTKQLNVLNQRQKLVTEQLSDFKKRRLTVEKLLSSLNRTIRAINTLLNLPSLPKRSSASDAEVAAINLRNRIRQEINRVKTLRSLINQCASGINPRKGSGTPQSPTVEPIVVVTSNKIVGGALITTVPLKVQFSRNPGGYNACVKLVYPNGFVGGVYTGMGLSGACYPGNFGDVSPEICQSLIPRGRVGTVIELLTYNFVTLPGQTTSQLVDQMRLELISKLPAASVLAFLNNISRDESIKACNSF